MERDLLIRKLFTAGLDATTVNASAFSSFSAMLMSIWSTSRKAPSVEPVAALLMTSDKLPAQSLVVLAQPAAQRLANLAAETVNCSLNLYDLASAPQSILTRGVWSCEFSDGQWRMWPDVSGMSA